MADDARTPVRILVCEDDIPTLAQLQRIFESLGCEVATATTGTVALFKLRNEPFDMVVMDFQMPLKDASQTMVALSSSQDVKIPMILISSADYGREARELGFSAFYPKPITVAKAEEILKKYFPNR